MDRKINTTDSFSNGFKIDPSKMAQFPAAAKYGFSSKLQESLDKYGDAIINAQDEEGRTALMWSITRGDGGNVALLLNKGADVNLVTHQGETALLFAVQHHQFEHVKKLMYAGADKTLELQDAISPLGWAHQHNFHEAFRFLSFWPQNKHELQKLNMPNLEAASDLATEFVDSVKFGMYSQFDELLERYGSAIANQHDELSDTALLWAAGKGKAALIDKLYHYGADINKTNFCGTTALMSATSQKSLECVQLLLTLDADIYKTKGDGITAFDLAHTNGFIEAGNLLHEAHLAALKYSMHTGISQPVAVESKLVLQPRGREATP